LQNFIAPHALPDKTNVKAKDDKHTEMLLNVFIIASCRFRY
jgi:hypothetical protein